MDLNSWIVDTATAVHMTQYATGMHKIQEATRTEDTITVGDGTHMKVLRMSTSVTGMCCNMYGNELDTLELTDVTHLPNGKFNMFSLLKMQMNGWALHGNDKKIWITKGENIITFDIIPTNKGLLFAMYFRCKTEIAGAMMDNDPKLMKSLMKMLQEKQLMSWA